MFLDEIKMKLMAWKWWNWHVSWRREKFIPKWWPRWGNWGNWGNIYIQTNSNLNTLSDFRHKKVIEAKPWEKWLTNLMQWACWEDLVLFVPVWTIIKDLNTQELIIDLSQNNMKFLICKWGRWWYWNAHFTTSTRQAPSFAEFWDIWEEREVTLELKLVADIGIIWVPSSWKSTLIWNITNVKPKIWDYPFTTLTPNLWVLEHKWKALVLEDVPWLIPGASKWKGLWITFLKHIERTKVLLHLLDLYRLDQVLKDYEDIRHELKEFSQSLDEKQEIIVFSKWDLLDKEMKDFIVSEFKKKFKNNNIFVISSATWEWIQDLKDYLIDNFTTSIIENEELNFVNKSELKIIDLKFNDDPKQINLNYLWEYTFRASWKRLEQIVRMTNFENDEAIMRVYDVLDKLWVIKKIESKIWEIIKEENIDNSFFFEWEESSWFTPKVIVWDREIPLEKLKFNF